MNGIESIEKSKDKNTMLKEQDVVKIQYNDDENSFSIGIIINIKDSNLYRYEVRLLISSRHPPGKIFWYSRSQIELYN